MDSMTTQTSIHIVYPMCFQLLNHQGFYVLKISYTMFVYKGHSSFNGNAQLINHLTRIRERKEPKMCHFPNLASNPIIILIKLMTCGWIYTSISIHIHNDKESVF
jgi:hypothetical protein